jgi:signal peptidase II
LDLEAASTANQAAAVTARPSWTERVLAYRLLWALALGVFTLDLVTKTWIVARIPYAENPYEWPPVGSISVIDGFFHLVHVGNTGAAWSLFEGKSNVLAVLAGVTLLGIFYWRRHLGLHARRAQIAFGLLCGGIVGNFLDRVLHNHVIDFLDFHFGSYIYPTFNIADAGICVGVLLYLWHSFKEPMDEPEDDKK